MMNIENKYFQWIHTIVDFYNRCIMKIRHETLIFNVRHSKISALNNSMDANESKQKIVVSLTSFPARFQELSLCLKSLFRQSVAPDHIILWLGSDSIKSNYKDVFRKYINLGLEIYIDEKNNYKSHKKYLYVFKKYPDALIITVDDDLVYPKNMIETLLKGHKLYPNAVIARRVHKIIWNENGEIKPYLQWEGECENVKKPSHSLVATTGAGTLFPPNSLYKDYCNIDLISQMAPTADDIWLKFMELLQGTKVVWTENNMKMPASLKSSHIAELAIGNCNNGENDLFVNQLMTYYNLTKKDFDD